MRAQQLDRESGIVADTAVLDIGVQDSGTDGALWALTNRGVAVTEAVEEQLATVWTARGAPHVYRLAELPSVAAAVAPFSEADAGKRIYDAAKPLKAAGIPVLSAMDTVASALRSLVVEPTAKGTVSGGLNALLDAPYQRDCRSCKATHIYEMPFRLAALHAGLQLRPGTSPPVLERIPGFEQAPHPDERHDVIRAYLRLLGPATPKDVASYLDAPVREIKDRWPADAVEVVVDGVTTWSLGPLSDDPPPVTRLLGPFDLFLQAKDRWLVMPDQARAKALWPVLGRPGAVLHHGEIVGTWRPRKSAKTLTLQVEPWARLTAELTEAITEQAERLAAHRGTRFAGLELKT